ncbi:MAG: HAMP domain-containing protein [Deltaproteobacteria bacterium]|nr:HAMP domain-containing protein [Deltaproteobacteria bacterium]MBN2670186.1 HAMP domain-containing protein [Deltaproteobacteria bacterium]
MKIRTKILLLLLLGAIVPLSISFIFADRIISADFSRNLRERAENETAQVTARTNERIDWTLEVVTMVVDAVPFENLDPVDLPQALNIMYTQLTFANMVALLDNNGKAVVPPHRPTRELAQYAERPYVDESEMADFAGSVPLDAALKAELAMGPIYFSSDDEPRVVVTKLVHTGRDDNWVLAIGVSLTKLCETFQTVSEDETSISVLVDTRGEFICGSGISATLISNAVKKQLKTRQISERDTADGAFFLVQEPVPVTGWRVFHQYSKASAMKRFHQTRQALLLWMVLCLVAAIAGGFVLSKGITHPIAHLAAGSKRVAEGNYDEKIDIISKDELGDLSHSFNKMVEEIHTWNRELNQRVYDRTKALKEAQEQIVKTQKLAALGELGAGVAHEINNPLTSVVGNAQFLMSELDDSPTYREILKEMVDNSRRVAQVVDELLRFSQAQWGEKMMPVSLEKVMVHAVDFYLERFKEKNVEVMWAHKDEVSVYGIERDLQLVAHALLDNALKAVGDGGQILFTIRQMDEGAVVLGIQDNGVGMDESTRLKAIDPFFTTSPPGSNSKGIGLTTVQRIVDEHEAKLTIESAPGRGTLINIYFASDIKVSKA